TDKAGRVPVGPDLTLPGHPEVFVIGDMALTKYPDGSPMPGVAQVAMQGGVYAAKSILGRLRGKPVSGPFKYFDKGNMATVGRNYAVVDMYFIRLSGYLAWLAWLFIHIVFLVRFENRILVMIQ